MAQGMTCDEHGNVPYSSPFKTGLVARLLNTKRAVRRQPSAVSPLGTDSLLGHATLKFFGFASSHLPPPYPISKDDKYFPYSIVLNMAFKHLNQCLLICGKGLIKVNWVPSTSPYCFLSGIYSLI